MYRYNLKYKIEQPENALWTEQVHEKFFKSSYEKNGIFHEKLIKGAKAFIQARNPLKIIHLEDVESLDANWMVRVLFNESEKMELEDLTAAEAGYLIIDSSGIAAPNEIIEPTKNIIYL